MIKLFFRNLSLFILSLTLSIGLCSFQNEKMNKRKQEDFQTFESGHVTRMLLNILKDQFDKVLFKRVDSVDLVIDSTIQNGYPERFFKNMNPRVFDSLHVNQIENFALTLSDIRNYRSAQWKNGMIENYDCMNDKPYNVLVIAEKNNGKVVKLLFSTESHRFCLFYQFRNEVFLLFDSCINNAGWNKISQLLGIK